MTRIWPKAAILILITLYFGLVHAVVVEGPFRGRGHSDDGRRLRQQLEAFYAVPRARLATVEVERYHSAVVVPVILEAVVRHALDPDTSVQRRNKLLITWARQLVEASPMDVDRFGRTLIARHTARLFTRYETPGTTRDDLILILDRLDLWRPVHLIFLAHRAGSRNDHEAEEFGYRALEVIDEAHPAETEEMVKIIRRQIEPRRAAQWALITRSGHVTDDDLAALIALLAHEYAFAGGDVARMPSLGNDEPLRDVVERFMGGLAEQDETTHSAYLMAQDASVDVGDEDSPLVHRTAFFRHLIEGTLFGEGGDGGGNDGEPVDVPAAINENPAPAPRAPLSYGRDEDGTVVYPKFRGCEGDLAGQ